MRTIISAILFFASAMISAQNKTAPAPDFSKCENWYGAIFTTDKKVDVLFFPPTSVSDSDHQGRNMNPRNTSQRQAMDYWYGTAKALYGESCNFYGPYYRQVTMESWGKPYFQECAAVAISDVVAAFDYYMEHHNNGRPFILAGTVKGH